MAADGIIIQLEGNSKSIPAGQTLSNTELGDESFIILLEISDERILIQVIYRGCLVDTGLRRGDKETYHRGEVLSETRKFCGVRHSRPAVANYRMVVSTSD